MITSFDSHQRRRDIDTYLTEVKHQVKFLGHVDEDSKIILLTQSLGNGPRDWTNNYITDRNPTFGQLCDKLKKRFRDLVSPFARMRAFMDRKQSCHKNPSDFFDDLKHMYKKYMPAKDYNEHYLRQAFVENLQEDIKGHVIVAET
ncbi:hypothetical protein AAFF_G00289850 [Aldrovandia affinis]|uniref:Uncharacterized protein n=1 Tax=Aldrovandia affinis TaxID=143900 RepID=A0AAD7W1R3_9TELE|nr:hypothetical protein AAFF_G00289850 [Aldrovandia affinis]